MISATDIIPLIQATGTGDIDHTFQKGDNKPFVLSSVEVHFSGGAGTASLTIVRQAYLGAHWNTTLFTLTAAGTDGSDVNFFVPDDEIERRYIFDGKQHTTPQLDRVYLDVDRLKIAWTNPDPAVMRWALTVGLAHATNE